MSDLRPDPLFLAPTRPAMKWGVTIEAIFFGAMITAIVFIGSNMILSLLIYVPIHIVMYLLCLKDPNIIRLLMLWSQTKLRSTAWRYWGSATASPQKNVRKDKQRLK